MIEDTTRIEGYLVNVAPNPLLTGFEGFASAGG